MKRYLAALIIVPALLAIPVISISQPSRLEDPAQEQLSAPVEQIEAEVAEAPPAPAEPSVTETPPDPEPVLYEPAVEPATPVEEPAPAPQEPEPAEEVPAHSPKENTGGRAQPATSCVDARSGDPVPCPPASQP